MTKAQDRLIKSIRTRNFEKFISVAHKDNGDDFFHEVNISLLAMILAIFDFLFNMYSGPYFEFLKSDSSGTLV